MKVEGLGDERRAELFQIRTLVEDVHDFSSDQFKSMVAQYKEQDLITYQILTQATELADESYTRYLNGVLVGGKMGLDLMPLRDSGESPILGKVMSEMRERLKNEKEYRKQFLGPQIGKQMQVQEIQLRKIQKQEVKRQREEMKAFAKTQVKGIRFFDFGR